MFKYIYPIVRYHELETTVTIAKPFEKKEIMDFYQTQISQEDLERIIEGYNSGEIGDCWNYIKNEIINRSPERPPVTYREIMGDSKFYEGLESRGNRTYYVCLGS